MAIIHNLSNLSDNLSGFDPVEGIADGTNIGKEWLMWKIFTGMQAFDPHIKLITSSSPTPAFLQSEAGLIQSEPAQSASNINHNLRFYYDNDAGLSQSPQSALIYEMSTQATSTGYWIVFWMRIRFKVDGSTLFAPSASSVLWEGWTDNNWAGQVCMWQTSSATTNVMANIPKMIFWKSQNANMIMTISKIDGSCKGVLTWFTPTWTGYKHNVGAITQGVNLSSVVFMNGTGFAGYIEGFSESYDADNDAMINDVSFTNSAGRLPTNLFTFGGVNNLVGGNLWVSVVNNTDFKVLTSSAIEGILLANTTAANRNAGTIYVYNSKNYLHSGNCYDGRDYYKVLYELG